MPRTQHEIPTHLNVEDKVLLGLTVRQLLYLMVGCSLGYGLASHGVAEHALGALVGGQAPRLAEYARLALAGACVLLAAAFALVRPLGRSLEEWLVAGACYVATPRRATWQPPAARASDWVPASGDWQELAPALDWPAETTAPAPPASGPA
jgi:PrgI family protein